MKTRACDFCEQPTDILDDKQTENKRSDWL